MIFKTQTILSIAALLIIFSCNRNRQQRPLSFAPKVVEAHGYVVPKDSMAEPKVIPAGKPRIVRAGKPKVVLTNTNVHPAGIPRVVKAGIPKVCIPGKDGFSLPKTVPAVDSPFIAGIPEVVIAKDPFSKDQNPQNFSSFSKLQGLKSDDIRCLLEDKRGNLWIGTNWGASKYDGKNFTHFTAKEGLGSNSNEVESILEDKSGNLWFGTFGEGVCKYDGKSFTHFTEKEGLSNNHVSSIVEDTRGNLWFVTQGGVNKYDGKSFTHFTDKQGLSNHVGSILADKDGNIWFGTGGEGAIKYDGKSFTHFTKKEGLSDGVGSIIEDKNGSLWFAIDGVSKYDGKSFTHFTKKEGLIENGALSMMEDNSGNLWFGGGDGVSKYDGKSFIHFTDKEGLNDNHISNMLKDKRGNLWFGTNGLNKYGGKRFTHYTKEEGLSNNGVLSILQDKSGSLWFGTAGGGVNKYDGKSFTHFTKKEGMTINVVFSMLEDKSGNLWFSDWGGVSKYDGKSFTRFDIPGMDVKSMLQDKSGNLWFGTYEGGAFKYDGKSFTRFTVKEGLSNNIVWCIYEDKSGNLWFGTHGGGVTKYDPAEGGKSFTHFTEKEGLGNNSVFSILEDNSGNLWFGTLGGVSKYDGKNFTHFTEKEGLSNNTVLSILEDKSGNLWFGTRFGLSKLEKDKIASGLSDPELLFKTYTYEDGFSGFNVNLGKSMYEARDGTIWIGAGERLTAFHPGEDIPDTIPPNIQLTGVTLFNENIVWQNLEKKTDTSIVLGNGVRVHDFHFDSVSRWYGIPERLSLAYNDNSLTFQFLGITLLSAKKVKYKFKLEGLDKNWSAMTNRSEAPYGNLPHGKYTFKVKAMNGDGYWSKEFNYSFVIRPPWWYTWWAYVLYTMLLAVGIWSIVYYRLKSLRRELEQRKKEQQLTELKQQKTELEMQALRAQMNPHFIFNSLNSISLFILQKQSTEAIEYLSKFSRLIRMILNSSANASVNLAEDLEALQIYLELESLRFEKKFSYKIECDPEIEPDFIQIPPMLLQPFVENAIWHGLMHKKEKGHLWVDICQEESTLICTIKDDGIGRKKAAELKNKSGKQKSMGMKITESRIAMMQKMNGKDKSVEIKDLIYADGSAAGTEVVLKIPIMPQNMDKDTSFSTRP